MSTPNDNRPPFVSFEVKAVEDRVASLKTGVYMTKDVDFIKIIPSGDSGKTVLEYVYAEWLSKTRKQTGEIRDPSGAHDTPLMGSSRFPIAWLNQIEEAYAAWQKGLELPLNGTPIRNWPAISPAMAKNCEALHIQTVEVLADATDDTVRDLGMGGIILRQRARDWLAAERGDSAPLAAKLEAAASTIASQAAQLESMSARLKSLEGNQKAA